MTFFKAEKIMENPVSESVRKIDFEDAQVNGGFVNGTYFLTVSGEKPYINMEVRLSPLIYVKRPEFWQIEVLGILPGFGLPAFAPYSETISLDGVIGTKGIEVVGATVSKLIDIADPNVELCGVEWEKVRYRANQVPGGVIIMADGEHNTSGYEAFFEQLPIDIFPPQFALKHRRPEGSTLDVITPFHVNTSFKASDKIDEVIIHDATGKHAVAVEQTPD